MGCLSHPRSLGYRRWHSLSTWHLSHYFKDREVGEVGKDTPVKDVRIDLLPPDLSDPLAEVSMPSNHDTFYLDRVFYTFKPGEWRNNAVWISVTTAKGIHSDSYRDHKDRSMLAKNGRADINQYAQNYHP